MAYFCPLCKTYHDTTGCPTRTTLVSPNLNLNSSWKSTGLKLDKITELLEQILQEIRNK